MEQRLSEILTEVPNDVFFDHKGDPNFNAIFVEVARIVYKEKGGHFAIPAEDFLGDRLPNLSSFQRTVTKERQRRKG
jgi:hypothetical protein